MTLQPNHGTVGAMLSELKRPTKSHDCEKWREARGGSEECFEPGVTVHIYNSTQEAENFKASLCYTERSCL